MVGNLITSMFLLYAFVLPVNPIDPVMALVNVCPKNESDVIQASKRLGCGKDKYGTIQYLCLPNKEKTSLVEFCYQGVMGLMEKGNCIEFSEGKWIYHNCIHFLYGCPEKDLEVFEIYKYPECQNINTHLQCFVMDKNCTAQSDTGESPGQHNVILISCIIIGVILFTMCTFIIFIFKRRRANRNKKKEDTDKSSYETSILLSEDQVKVTDRTETPVSGERDLETVTDRTANPVSGEGDLETVTDRTANPVSGIHFWNGKDIRIVLIGTTRSGKSATGKTILRKTFPMRRSLVSGECVMKSAVRFDKNICIVDTPGICKSDTTQTIAKIQREILKSISMSCPGPHAIVLVTSLKNYTDDELNSIRYFEDLFGEHIFKFLIILFTRKDHFDYQGKSLEDHIKTLPSNLQAGIKRCEERVIAFNNKIMGDKGDDQVKELLSMIINTVENNNGECYNSEMYMEADKRLQERETTILEKEKKEGYITKSLSEPARRLKYKTT